MPHGVGELLAAIRENDPERIEATILRMSQNRRIFAPLAFGVGAFALLFEGLRLLVTNWRLTLVQILPAMWIWLATYDLKVHVLHGRSFNVVRGPLLIPIFLVIVAVTVGSFFLNGVFAFAINRPGKPAIGPAIATAKHHIRPIAVSGAILGLALAFSTTVVTRWGRPWFALCLGVVVGAMMVSYVAVPARLLGVQSNQSRRDKLWASGLGAALGATVCTPPYVLARVGILMLGSKALIIPGIFVLTLGVALQAGATGAVSAIKMSTKLRVGAPTERTDQPVASGG
ncbi:MAG TPA: hypothetical protein VGI50_02515 [Solirubrobacteraceae bacterium]|jgi:hypothetical protein